MISFSTHQVVQFIIVRHNSKCFLFLTVQEQVDQTYIMVKPDGVQRGLVRILIYVHFNFICFGFRH
jgi:hypothetical protein